MNDQPVIVGLPPRERPFAAFAVAIQVIIVNEAEEVLLLSSPTRNKPGEWQVVSGGLDAGETVLAGALREAAEEVGDGVRLRPLGVCHVQSFHYDANVRHMIGIHYLMAYQGGTVVPGDDMAGSAYRWWSLAELETADVTFAPSTNLWRLRRAVELHRLWHKNPPPLSQLQAPLL